MKLFCFMMNSQVILDMSECSDWLSGQTLNVAGFTTHYPDC